MTRTLLTELGGILNVPRGFTEMTIAFHGQGPTVLVPQPPRDGWDVHPGLDAGSSEEVSEIVMGENGQLRPLTGFSDRRLGILDRADRVLVRGLGRALLLEPF